MGEIHAWYKSLVYLIIPARHDHSGDKITLVV